MKIIDFQEIKEKKTCKKTLDEDLKLEMRKEIRLAYIYSGLKQYKVCVDKLEKINIKYKNRCNDILNYVNLYRFLGEAYDKLGDKESSQLNYKKLKILLDKYEIQLLSKSPHTYILGLNNYYEFNKFTLSKKEKININRKIYNCSLKNNFHTELVLAAIRIKILEEQYAEVLSSLGSIHKDKQIILEKIKDDLKNNGIEIYNKYIKLNKIYYNNKTIIK